MYKWWKNLEQWQRGLITLIVILAIGTEAGFLINRVWMRKKRKQIIDALLQKYQALITKEKVLTSKTSMNTASDGINNPLNIRQKIKQDDGSWVPTGIKWHGTEDEKKGADGPEFEQFDFIWQGWRAGMKNVINNSRKKVALSGSFNDTIPVLSPSQENDVPAYIQAIQNAGIDTTVKITDLAVNDPDKFKSLIKAMAIHEQGDSFQIVDADVDLAYESLDKEGFFTTP